MNDETLIDRNLLLLRSPDAKPSGPPAQTGRKAVRATRAVTTPPQATAECVRRPATPWPRAGRVTAFHRVARRSAGGPDGFASGSRSDKRIALRE